MLDSATKVNSLADLSFDWYCLSLSNFRYGW